ncbi:hypothetical protein FB45DRAFT_893333 [Roridomyces roridus]|uniref:Proteophosphoglycan ppg4 n=1 Tax=Roridomyces roridus TaxID=1738132 RepID=A0AAD7CFC5_9AGAR|nr:hypothetical protein FB45DRAFT_893333 [Roridomyces roridus]
MWLCHELLTLFSATLSTSAPSQPSIWPLSALVPRRASLLLISFGVGTMSLSLRKPLADWAGLVYPKGDLRSLLCIIVCTIVALVLAYLTNPSENSFRTYLTEQSFRHHLSRLDENSDDQHAPARDKHNSSQRRGSTPPSATVPFDHGSPFHFANRASVSLRTPRHVFHSFGIFTVAAIVPARADRARRDRDSTIVTDSWFVGVYGRWYRGGVLDAWYQDVVARSSDEESWTSGILGMKALDKLNDYEGLPFSTKNLPAARSPPKLRNRDKSSQRLPTARSSTPPPLPKSASLPLHTPRPPTTADRPHTSSSPNHPSQTTEQNRLSSPALSRSPSTLFDQSPRIAEVLHQISLSKSSVLDLRTQLADFQVSASTAHASLQEEVDSFRDRKRQEDASRSELKSRTKTLDDSKRAAESLKREAEKRLRAAENARDDASQRMEHLDTEITSLQNRLADDQSSVLQSQTTSQSEQEIADSLDSKRQEIKVTEDVVAALNLRARELEDKLASERQRLRLARERAELKKQDHSFNHHLAPASTPWSLAPRNLYDSNAPGDAVLGRARRSSDPHGTPTSPRPSKLALGAISNFNNTAALGNVVPGPRSTGYSIFDDVFLPPVSGHFSPFGDAELRGQVLSPTSQSLIPSSLITSLDSGDGSSRSFQSDSDAFMDKDWREASSHRTRSQHTSDSQMSPSFGPVTMSPTSLHAPTSDAEHDPFEVRVRGHLLEYPMDSQRASLGLRTVSDAMSPLGDEELVLPTADKAVSRRWFTSTKEKAKKGLNPDAKVFSLPRKAAPPSYDALNPNGLGSNMLAASASANHSLLRAFAPSPAEREALQRALGGSTNTSLERLPSLSEMGSVPSSPSHVHAVPAAPRVLDNRSLPSWLSALPRIRKPNFSPWDDEENDEDKKEERR